MAPPTQTRYFLKTSTFPPFFHADSRLFHLVLVNDEPALTSFAIVMQPEHIYFISNGRLTLEQDLLAPETE